MTREDHGERTTETLNLTGSRRRPEAVAAAGPTITAAPETADIPVIFLSAKCTDADRAEGIAAGAAGYLAKPFDPMELADRVKSILAANA